MASAIDSVLNDFFLIQKDVESVTGLYQTVIREAERAVIKRVMRVTGRNKKASAKILGISRNTLNSKITNLDIE
jgi:DNA-binding protein Fis